MIQEKQSRKRRKRNKAMSRRSLKIQMNKVKGKEI
jgi:hypothetical protein